MDKTQEDPRIGAVLGGRYRITTLLGEGGMGLVYRGERLQLGKPVAIKFLHSPYARSPKFVARFEREARAMSKLSHPHCVSVIDFGVQDAPYIVMDFVTGSTLREVLDSGPVPVTRTLSIVKQTLYGLAHAHSEGVIHRDIKPGNVMLGELAGMGDHVRIFDFGLAKLRDGEVDGDASTAAIVGTPAYMAPEQARADKIDARADLYATGVLLFEMLTGEKPFQGNDAYTVLVMQRDKLPPKLRDLKPQLSVELEQVVAKALEKDVDKRFQTAGEFVTALEGVPEATGRLSSVERELPGQPIGFAKTEHQLKAPSVEEKLAPTDPTQGSLAGTTSAVSPKKGGGAGRWLWTMFVLAAVAAGAFLMLRGKVPSEKAPEDEEQAALSVPVPGAAERRVEEPPLAAPIEQPASEAIEQPEPAAPAELGEAPMEIVDAQSPLAEPAPAEPAEPMEPTGADELSEAALAAADEALNDTTEQEVPVVASAPPVQTVAAAKLLVQQKKLDDAIASIRSLRKKNPKNAELPFMLGDLYFERGWWSDGLAKYREAIRITSGYKQRASLQRNAIRALADDRTYPRARALLVKDVGRASAGRLRKAAKSDALRVVRKRASSVLAQLSR